MPRYPYICDACGHRGDVFKSMSRYEDPEKCPECGIVMKREFMQGCPSTLDRAFRKPIEMYSIAPETPQQMVDLQKKLPDTQFTRDLVPIAHSRAEKLRLLKAVDFQELS